MDTLMLMQNDPAFDAAFNKMPIQPPSGIFLTEHLNIADPAAAAALGLPTAKLGAAFLERRMKDKIVQFGEINLQHEEQNPAKQQSDIAEFQIVIFFHQTATPLAKVISNALASVGMDHRWIRQPYKHHRAHRVRRVWILSCESAADEVTTNVHLNTYIVQALTMRRYASAGLMTPREPPIKPDPPKEWYYPDVYTFSTGDPVTGGVKMHPTHVSFVQTPDWHIDHGEIVRIHPDTPDPENNRSGKIYKYQEGQPVQSHDVPAGREVNILSEPPPF